jgi:hypothetical protein
MKDDLYYSTIAWLNNILWFSGVERERGRWREREMEMEESADMLELE